MVDIIIILVLLAILGGAGMYVYKARKSGKKCIGCPESGCSTSGCSGSCGGCSCGCGSAGKAE